MGRAMYINMFSCLCDGMVELLLLMGMWYGDFMWICLLATSLLGQMVCDVSRYSFDCLHDKEAFFGGDLDTSATIECLLWAFHSVDNNFKYLWRAITLCLTRKWE